MRAIQELKPTMVSDRLLPGAQAIKFDPGWSSLHGPNCAPSWIPYRVIKGLGEGSYAWARL